MDWQMRLAFLGSWHRWPPHAHICARVSPAHRVSRAAVSLSRAGYESSSWPLVDCSRSRQIPRVSISSSTSRGIYSSRQITPQLLLLDARTHSRPTGAQAISRSDALASPSWIPTTAAWWSGSSSGLFVLDLGSRSLELFIYIVLDQHIYVFILKTSK